ncbi:MAG: hypothetical protein IK003_06700 [Prevotella sp.]|jgi:hypothetical protein|nr:hypothetical protein [Prevotella sp.]
MNKKQIRNWLNIIFMVTAVIGVIMFLSKNETTHMRGLYLILIAMCVKITESAMRMIK